MPSGSCRSLSELPTPIYEVVEASRRAVLATIDKRDHPHAVPVCFAIADGEIVTALDRKPKSGGTLGRVRNLKANPVATVLFDRYEEEWTQLAWVMVRGTARIEPPGTGRGELVERYSQYRTDPPTGDVIVVRPEHIAYWSYTPLS